MLRDRIYFKSLFICIHRRYHANDYWRTIGKSILTALYYQQNYELLFFFAYSNIRAVRNVQRYQNLNKQILINKNIKKN